MRISALLLMSFVLMGAVQLHAGENREVRLDLEKEKIERAELRAAIEREHPVAAAEHKEALAELRAKLAADEKLDYVVELNHLHRRHPVLVEHLLHHIHEERERLHRK